MLLIPLKFWSVILCRPSFFLGWGRGMVHVTGGLRKSSDVFFTKVAYLH